MIILLDKYATEATPDNGYEFTDSLADIICDQLRNLAAEHERLSQKPKETLSDLETQIVNLDLDEIELQLVVMSNKQLALRVS